MKTDIAFASLIVSKNPNLSTLKSYLFKYKRYTDWLGYLQFWFVKLNKDLRLTSEEREIVCQQKKLIARFQKSKRPAVYLKKHLDIFGPLIELLVKYEQ